MNKKLNFQIFLGIFICICLVGVLKYNYNIYENQIITNHIKELKLNIKQEYKHRLKDMVNTTINFIDSMEKVVLNNYLKIMNIELTRIIKEINNSDEKHIDEYILKYKHDFMILSKEEPIGIIKKSFEINQKMYFLNVRDEIIKDMLVSSIREFLYSNVTSDNRYIWINEVLNFQGGNHYAISLIHPNLKDAEGMLLSTNMEDVKGNKPFLIELNGININKEIYFEYFFKTINSEEVSKKITYSKLYKKRNWIISAGIPLIHLTKIIKEKAQEAKTKYEKVLDHVLILEIQIFSLLLGLFFLLRNKLSNYFKVNQNLKQKLEEKLVTVEGKANSFFDLFINLHFIANTTGTILQVNSACKNILGYEIEELINISFLDLVHIDDRENTIKEMKKLEQGKVIYYFENRYLHKNGTYITLAWSANTDTNNKIIYASAQNITKIKSIELEKKKQDEVIQQQSKMATMGEMIAYIAHQWRQPLANLNGLYLNLEIDYNKKLLNKKVFNKYLLQMEDITMYLSSTINDFSGFFKITKGKSNFDIKDTLIKSSSMINSVLKKNDIELVLEIEKSIFINAYPSELMQVIFTIINNSKDAFERKSIKNKYIKVSLYQKNKKIFLEFEDNAEGINEELINRIFESYFSTKHKLQGTGLGLYIAKLIIEKSFQGEIHVENTKNGALFTIILCEEYL